MKQDNLNEYIFYMADIELSDMQRIKISAPNSELFYLNIFV
jgi:hypothetical protein